MRVIAGEVGGMKLKEVPGSDTRPTLDHVKEALFNIIQFEIEGKRCLDLFAGTGQLGIEALSRGAAQCTFIDSSRAALGVIRENLAKTKLSERSTVWERDALAFLKTARERYDLLFADPPYAESLLSDVLFLLPQIDIVAENGIIVCESKVCAVLPDLSPKFTKSKDYRYGRTKLTLYRRV